MSFLRNLSGVLLTGAVGVPVGMATSIVLARYLGTDDRGLYAIAQSFAALLAMLSQFGWPTASIDRLRRGGGRPAEVVGAALLFLGGVSLLVVAAGWALEAILRERFLSDLPVLVFGLALATVPLRLLANGFGSIARGIDRFRYENGYTVLLGLANLVMVVIVLVFLGGALRELMAAVTAVALLLVAGLVAVVIRETGARFSFPRDEIAESLRFGLKTYAMTVAGRAHERVDLFLLAALLADPTQIAFYAIAKGMAQILQLLPNSLAKAAYPQLAGLDAQRAAEFAARLVRQNLLLLVPAALLLAAVAPLLLPLLYGDAYSASAGAFVLLLPGTVLLGCGSVVSRYFTGTNEHRPNIITRFVSLTLNVVLNIWWIPNWGIQGAAAAALVSYSVDAALVVVVFLLRSEVRLRELVVFRRSDLDPYRELLGRARLFRVRAP